jgi:hypothetical protein
MRYFGFFLLALAPLSASTISSVSVSNGTPFAVAYSSFAATETNMAGRLSITADFGVNGTSTCSWTANAANCTGTGFSVIFTDGDTYPTGGSHFWTITNTGTFTLSAITFNGVTGAGNGVAFDRCMSGSSTFNDTESGGNCGTEGTAGSNIGWSASSAAGGSSGTTATALYSNILNLSSQSAVGDAFGVLKLTFGGTAFTRDRNFTFEADTDLVSASGVPEPGTLALLGGGLLGLGFIARRRAQG